MADAKKPKTVKSFKRGQGIEEQVLFDDEFNWDLVSEESAEHVHERAAELDRIELDRMSLDEPEQGEAGEAESEVPPGAQAQAPDTDEGKAGRSIKKAVFIALAGIVLMASAAAGFLGYKKLFPKETVEEQTAHIYTASINLSEEGPLELEPFVIPTGDSKRRKFVLIYVFVSINPLLKGKLEARLPEVRNMIYENLKAAWAQSTPRLRVQELVDSINEMVDVPVVQKLVFEERQEDQEADGLPVAKSLE